MPKILKAFASRLGAAYGHFRDDDGTMMAAAMAYYLALSFFPLLLVLVAGLGFVLESTSAGQSARQQLLAALEQQASPDLSEQVGRAINVANEQAPAGGSIAFLALVATAIALFAQIDRSMDRIWNVAAARKRGWWRWLRRWLMTRLKALCMLVAAGGFVIAVMIASIAWSAAQAAAEPAVPLSPSVRWGMSLVLNMSINFLLFAAIYRFVPKVYISWPEALSGACVAAVLWEAGRQLLAIYLVRHSHFSAYGVIGSFLAIMLWMYYAMLVVFFGAEYIRAANHAQLQKRG